MMDAILENSKMLPNNLYIISETTDHKKRTSSSYTSKKLMI